MEADGSGWKWMNDKMLYSVDGSGWKWMEVDECEIIILYQRQKYVNSVIYSPFVILSITLSIHRSHWSIS